MAGLSSSEGTETKVAKQRKAGFAVREYERMRNLVKYVELRDFFDAADQALGGTAASAGLVGGFSEWHEKADGGQDERNI
jgi:hypothetical protein